MNIYNLFQHQNIELVNIDKNSQEEAILIFITKEDLNMTEMIILQRMTVVKALD